MPRMATGKTPFSLAYETEAIVPLELQVLTHQIQFNDEILMGIS